MPTFNLTEHEAMHQEWTTWTECVVPEFKTLGIELNEPRFNRLARAIEMWGEELVHLRYHQSPEVHAKALEDKRDAYLAETRG